MNYTGIVSNADILKKQSVLKVLVADNVRELLYKINSSIMDCHRMGKTNTRVDLPINFSISDPNISNMDVQTSVYYKIVSELEKNNYLVKFIFYKQSTVLYIDWLQHIDDNELIKMREKILMLSVRPDS